MALPRYNPRKGWVGGDNRTLYAFTDRRTGRVAVQPGGGAGRRLLANMGSELDVRVATRREAEELWQNPLHVGWKTLGATMSRRRRKKSRGLSGALGMSKKDYISIGDALCQHDASPGLVDAIAGVFAADNPAFQRARFVAFVSKCKRR